jgi:hypothetical protein
MHRMCLTERVHLVGLGYTLIEGAPIMSQPQTLSLVAETAEFGEPAAHGELGCADVEALLTEAVIESDTLRDQVAMYEQMDRSRQADMDEMALRCARLQALVGDVSKKMRRAVDTKEGSASQIEMLLLELEAAEAAAVPEGTLMTATLSVDQMTALYRGASRVTRGPLPPAVVAAVKDAEGEIVAAMQAAGEEVLAKTVKSAVRRRKAAATRKANRRAAVAAARASKTTAL